MTIGNNPPDVQIEEIILEKIRFGIQDMMAGSLRNELSLVTDWDIFTDSVIRQLRGYLLGNKVNTEEFDDDLCVYPATIWEELKRDFCPKWLKRRFPVRYSRDRMHRTVNHYRVCPHLDIPSQEKHIRWLAVKDAE